MGSTSNLTLLFMVDQMDMVYFEYGGHHSHTLSHISKAILVMEQTNVFVDENKGSGLPPVEVSLDRSS